MLRRGVTACSGDLIHTHRSQTLLTVSLAAVALLLLLLGWRRGVVVSGVRHMNEVNARRARLVPGWVTVFGRVYHLSV